MRSLNLANCYVINIHRLEKYQPANIFLLLLNYIYFISQVEQIGKVQVDTEEYGNRGDFPRFFTIYGNALFTSNHEITTS